MEACAPGGTDATDGIAWAQAFASRGASYIVASAGSWAFPPLKIRRGTKGKGQTQLATNHAWLTSCAWLLGQVDVPVYACGPTLHPKDAKSVAQAAGFAGVIQWEPAP